MYYKPPKKLFIFAFFCGEINEVPTPEMTRNIRKKKADLMETSCFSKVMYIVL